MKKSLIILIPVAGIFFGGYSEGSNVCELPSSSGVMYNIMARSTNPSIDKNYSVEFAKTELLKSLDTMGGTGNHNGKVEHDSSAGIMEYTGGIANLLSGIDGLADGLYGNCDGYANLSEMLSFLDAQSNNPAIKGLLELYQNTPDKMRDTIFSMYKSSRDFQLRRIKKAKNKEKVEI